MWLGGGINYGHQYPNNPYDYGVVARDFALLRSLGVTRIRIAYTPYNNANLPSLQDLALLAKEYEFYVIFGVNTDGHVSLTTWNHYQTQLPVIAAWAEVHDIDEFAVNNEIELNVDGVTLTVAQVQQDIRGPIAQSVKAVFSGRVSYQTDQDHVDDWIASGIGSLDRIGFNVYHTETSFRGLAKKIKTNFPVTGYVSEWNTDAGYSYNRNEYAWANQLVGRGQFLESLGLEGYFFCYRGGSFNVPQNLWGLQLSDGTAREALAYLSGAVPWYRKRELVTNREVLTH